MKVKVSTPAPPTGYDRHRAGNVTDRDRHSLYIDLIVANDSNGVASIYSIDLYRFVKHVFLLVTEVISCFIFYFYRDCTNNFFYL